MVGAASLWAAASGFLVLLVAARHLSPEENAEFLVFWAALFGVTGVLGGVTVETMRAAGAVTAGARGSRPGALIMPNALLAGAAMAGAVAGAGLPFADRLFSGHGTWAVLTLAAAAVMFSVHAAMAGALQGSGRWASVSALTALEASLRFGAVVLAALLGGSLFGVEAACLTALLAWLVLLAVSPSARGTLPMRADVPAGQLALQTGHALVSAAASAALIVSFPLLVKITTPPEDFSRAAPLLLAITLTRAPIMLPLHAFQGMVMAAVMASGTKALRTPVTATLALGAAGAGLSAAAGPQLMLILGPDYVVARWVLAALTIASAVIAVLTLTGTALLAEGRHLAYAGGWVAASVAAFGCLLVPLPIEGRCVLALMAGPAAGLAAHWFVLRRAENRPSPHTLGVHPIND